MQRATLVMLSSAIVAVLSLPARADDWPQWLGPGRDSRWRESGLVERFPKRGLKVKWRVPVAHGYAGPAVAGGKVFVADYVVDAGELTSNPGGRDKLEGRERVLCFDAATGRPLWKHEYRCSYHISYPNGPRCTPSIDAGRVYALGAEGNLLCLDADKGHVLWSKDFKRDYQAQTPHWGVSAHPLVDGDLVYCVVGGQGSLVVAFDKQTGREVWRSLSGTEPGYCPPTIIEEAGVRQLLIWDPENLQALDPATGKVLWSVPLKPDFHMSIAAPRKLGDKLFASGIGNVGALFKLDRSKPAVEVVWRGTSTTAVYCANSTPFLEEGMIYGVNCQSGALTGVRLEDGKRLWETFKPTSGDRRAGHATAFIVKQGDRFWLFNEKGDLILAKLTPKGYEELDRFHVLEPTSQAFGRNVVWSHPAFAERCCFARNDKELACVSAAAE